MSCSRFTSVFAPLFSLDMINFGTEKCTIEAEDTSVKAIVRINFVIREEQWWQRNMGTDEQWVQRNDSNMFTTIQAFCF